MIRTASFLVSTLLATNVSATVPMLSKEDIEAIGRTVFAEAGTESDAGKAGVVFTILNRYASGTFAGSVQSVIEQRNAFEPVTKAGGWRNLPPLTPAQRAKVETILSLHRDGALADVSGGALYFQNPDVVADRARAGTVRPARIEFGGMPATATIGAHTFYRPEGNAAQPVSAAIKEAPSELASRQVGGGSSVREATLFAWDAAPFSP